MIRCLCFLCALRFTKVFLDGKKTVQIIGSQLNEPRIKCCFAFYLTNATIRLIRYVDLNVTNMQFLSFWTWLIRKTHWNDSTPEVAATGSSSPCWGIRKRERPKAVVSRNTLPPAEKLLEITSLRSRDNKNNMYKMHSKETTMPDWNWNVVNRHARNYRSLFKKQHQKQNTWNHFNSATLNKWET